MILRPSDQHPSPDAGAFLRRSARANGAAGLLLTLALALVLAGVLGLGYGYVLKALWAYGLVVLILFSFLPSHGPRTRLGPANQVTLGRGVLTALLIALAGETTTSGVDAGTGAFLAWMALTLALLATLLDGVDGHLARRLGWASPLGARFDMEVDALLIAGLALLLWSLERAGPWVLAAGTLRYLFVAAAFRWPWLGQPLPPSRRRQTVCVVQILTLTLALVPLLPRTWGSLVAGIGLGLLVWSFALDIGWLARRRSAGTPDTGLEAAACHVPVQLHSSSPGVASASGPRPVLASTPSSVLPLSPVPISAPASPAPGGNALVRAVLLFAALGLLNLALSFHGRWPTLGVEWRWEVSPEIAILVLALGLAAGGGCWRPSRRLLGLLAAVLTLLVVVRYFAVMAPALYGRPVNLLAEARYLPDLLPMLLQSAPWPLLLGVPMALLLLLGLIYAVLRWALGRVAGALTAATSRRWLTLGAGASLAIWLAGLASPSLTWGPGFSRPVILELADQVRLAHPALAAGSGVGAGNSAVAAPGLGTGHEPEARAGAAAAAGAGWSPDLPPSNLGRVRGAHVVILFAESYGATTLDQPRLAAALAPARADLAAALTETGRGAVSARVRSPTFAGSSWLTHASFLAGVEVTEYDDYAALLTQDRETLVRRFARAGYRTLAVMPGLRYTWSDGTFYGFEAVLDAQALDYQGPDFGWWRIPDQFTLARLDDRELGGRGEAPAKGSIAEDATPTGAKAKDVAAKDKVASGTTSGGGTTQVVPVAEGGMSGVASDESNMAGVRDDTPRPRFVVVGTISSHAPFHPPPPYQPDWGLVLGPEPFTPPQPQTQTHVQPSHPVQEPSASDLPQHQQQTLLRPASAPLLHDVSPPLRGGENLLSDPGAAYVTTIDYLLRVLAGWLRHRSELDLVLLVIGDHQPLAAVSGEGANWEVPVHLITARPELREAFLAAGFVPGLEPGFPVLGGMADLSRLVLRAFGS